MSQQHRYTTPEIVTQNVARVASITYYPNRDGGLVEVIWEIGYEAGGVFTPSETASALLPYGTLPIGLQTTFDSLETSALNYGATSGKYPAGAVEPTA